MHGLRPNAAPLDLPEATQGTFINEWAMYLSELGRLPAAARCYEVVIEMMMRQEKWTNASTGNQNLCDVWLLSGRLSRLQKDAVGRLKDETDESIPPSSIRLPPSEESPATRARLGASSAGALATADEALRLAELANDVDHRFRSQAYRGFANASVGNVDRALADFHAALDLQHEAEPGYPDDPLSSIYGIMHTRSLSLNCVARGLRVLCGARQRSLPTSARTGPVNCHTGNI